MDRRAQQRGLDDRAVHQCAGHLVARETDDTGPESDVYGRRVLRLHAAHRLEHPRNRPLDSLKQELACEQGTIELALRECPSGLGCHAQDRTDNRRQSMT